MKLKSESNILFIVGVIFCILSLFVALNRNVWVDEAFTFSFVNADWQTLIGLIVTEELNMAPYYIFLKALASIDNSVVTLRLFSTIPALLLLLTVYYFCRNYLSVRYSLLICLFIATNQLFIRYAGEMRSYSWAMLFCTLAMVATINYLKKGNAKYLIYTAASALVAFYLAFMSSLMTIYFILILLIYTSKNKKEHFLLYVKCLATCFVLTLPVLYNIYVSEGVNLDWVKTPSVKDVYYLLVSLLGARWAEFEVHKVMSVIFFVGAVICSIYNIMLCARRSSRAENRELIVLANILCFSVIWTIGVFFFISLIQPIFVLRYMSMLIPVVMMIVGIGLYLLPNRLSRLCLLCCYLLFSVFLLWNTNSATKYLHSENRNWNEVVALLKTEGCGERDFISVQPFEMLRFNANVSNGDRKSNDLKCLLASQPNYFSFDTGGINQGISVHTDIRGKSDKLDTPKQLHNYRRVWLIRTNRDWSASHEFYSNLRDSGLHKEFTKVIGNVAVESWLVSNKES